MIAVTKVETVKIKSDQYYKIAHFNPVRLVPFDPIRDSTVDVNEYVTTETVQGEQFINGKGESVFIGWAKQVQDALGLPFRVFNRMQENIKILSCENAAQHQIIVCLNDENQYLSCENKRLEVEKESLKKENTDQKENIRRSLKERVKQAFFGDWD